MDDKQTVGHGAVYNVGKRGPFPQASMEATPIPAFILDIEDLARHVSALEARQAEDDRELAKTAGGGSEMDVLIRAIIGGRAVAMLVAWLVWCAMDGESWIWRRRR